MIGFWYHPPPIWANGTVFGVTTLLVLSSFSVFSSSLNFEALLCFDSSLLSRPSDSSIYYLILNVPDPFSIFAPEEYQPFSIKMENMYP